MNRGEFIEALNLLNIDEDELRQKWSNIEEREKFIDRKFRKASLSFHPDRQGSGTRQARAEVLKTKLKGLSVLPSRPRVSSFSDRFPPSSSGAAAASAAAPASAASRRTASSARNYNEFQREAREGSTPHPRKMSKAEKALFHGPRFRDSYRARAWEASQRARARAQPSAQHSAQGIDLSGRRRQNFQRFKGTQRKRSYVKQNKGPTRSPPRRRRRTMDPQEPLLTPPQPDVVRDATKRAAERRERERREKERRGGKKTKRSRKQQRRKTKKRKSLFKKKTTKRKKRKRNKSSKTTRRTRRR